ncbi:MAG: hypothetical protein A3A24_00960 [Candidatus Buchananbacteria bacterium RIFCSPLOWO2_01_FULL_46_12]|uniref:DUF5050 domain-containing protein n=2 Tax=Candidatus Buchananiibacteriota TaxID=1817903 RepID=A0A1G1YMY4_9BACT|nr:MAG: hypothetical protein A2744_02585 [Candidatus Buchananbacteria bacterium RIFCSPHIGHO2_01_FULL_44_11]OGY53722.1 MAG: hypothetical protein A3A24_00960 [Candidatus Buchananbacteria bacterium RIFCSPLOWO2_01_FULL_46_12]
MRWLYILTLIALTLSFTPSILAHSGQDGELVKSAEATAVYVVQNGLRYVFPDLKTYQSWYGNDFSAVKTVSKEELMGYQLKGNVTHKPGALIKIQTDPKVYEVTDDQGSMMAIQDEAEAVIKFGVDWAKLIVDVPDAFFVNYAIVTAPPPAEEPTPTSTPPTVPLTFDQTPAEPSKESTNLIRLTNNQLSDKILDIEWNDSIYGVLWLQNDDLYYTYILASTLNFGPPVKLNASEVKALAGQITWDGSYFAVAWTGQNGDQTNLYFSKLGIDGQIWVNQKKITTVDADSGVSITDNNDAKYAVAWDKSLTANADAKEIFFTNLDDVGVITSAIFQVSSSDAKQSRQPKVLWNNADYGLFWQDQRDGNAEIYYSRLDTSGSELTQDTRITNNESETFSPAITWDGTTYGLGFYDGRAGGGYYFNRVYSNGTKILTLDAKLASLTNSADNGIDITYLNNFYYLAAAHKTTSPKPDDGTEIYLIQVVEGGDVRLETRLTYNPWQASSPAIVESDDSFGIIWADGRATCTDCSLAEPKRDEFYFLKMDD